MEAAVVVALISSVSSLAVAAGAALWTSRQQNSLELLKRRLDRHGQFVAYLESDHPRRDAALLSTVYRLARYFGTLEVLYERVNYLKMNAGLSTRMA